MLEVGIVGLPNVGKSSLFNAVTAAAVPAENYPFCTVDPNVGTVEVPDARLDRIHVLAGSPEKVPTVIQFVDIAGLVRGASEGEGLGNRFLAQIRQVDAIAHVLRCFDDRGVVHVLGDVDPVRDRSIVETELALADLETVERRLERVSKKARSGEAEAVREEAALVRARDALAAGTPLRRVRLPDADRNLLRPFQLLTTKPVLHVANVSEDDLAGGQNPHVRRLAAELEASNGGALVEICTALEAELARLEPGEAREYLEALGMEEKGLDRLIHAAYDLLGLITFFTTGDKETRAWTLRRGATAWEAAGLIHSDFQRGFIRAETVSHQEFTRAGSYRAAREQGLLRAEGRDYVVRDGDILLFRFNV